MKFRLMLLTGTAGLLAAGAGAQDAPLKFGYINKMGDHPWFVSEVEGARAAAAELGVELLVQDVQFDANAAINAFDTMVGDGVKGIAIVVPDQSLGPVIGRMAAEAEIALVAVDDNIYDESGDQLPYVGIDTYTLGLQVGEELARLYAAEGWDAPDHTVGILSVEDRKVETCMNRNNGAQDAFLKAVPTFTADGIIRVPYDGTMVSAIDAVTTTLTANPQIDHWIVWSCNDDGVLGTSRALENAGGYDPATQMMGVGIDGSRVCEAFGPGNPIGYRGTLWLNSYNHGYAAIKALHENVVNGTPLPDPAFQPAELITLDNFADYAQRLGCST
jgi:L-arabinose transport system substrate-binding protein